jgi:hypothetical protein
MICRSSADYAVSVRAKNFSRPRATILFLGNAAKVPVVVGKHRDLFTGQLAGNTSHLLADVIAPFSALEELHLQFELGALLPPKSWGARCDAKRSMT